MTDAAHAITQEWIDNEEKEILQALEEAENYTGPDREHTCRYLSRQLDELYAKELWLKKTSKVNMS